MGRHNHVHLPTVWVPVVYKRNTSQSGIIKALKRRKTKDLHGFFFNSIDLLEESQSSCWNCLSPPPSSLPFLSSSALPSVLSHPWVWPTLLRTDRSVVSIRPHLPLHLLATLTWRRAGDFLLRTLAPSWGQGAMHWAFLVSWKQFRNSLQKKKRFLMITASRY